MNDWDFEEENTWDMWLLVKIIITLACIPCFYFLLIVFLSL